MGEENGLEWGGWEGEARSGPFPPVCFSTWGPGGGESLHWSLAALLKHTQSFVLIKPASQTSVWAQNQFHSISMRQPSTVVRTGCGLAGTQAPPLCGLGQVSPIFFFFLAVPHGLWDLSSLTRDGTWAHGSESAES